MTFYFIFCLIIYFYLHFNKHLQIAKNQNQNRQKLLLPRNPTTILPGNQCWSVWRHPTTLSLVYRSGGGGDRMTIILAEISILTLLMANVVKKTKKEKKKKDVYTFSLSVWHFLAGLAYSCPYPSLPCQSVYLSLSLFFEQNFKLWKALR